MDYKALILDLVSNETSEIYKFSLYKIKKLLVKYGDKEYKFDDFIKEYQANNECGELLDNLVERGYKFRNNMKNYMAKTVDRENLSWYINNTKKDDSHLLNPIIYCDAPDYDLFEELLRKNHNPNFDSIDELCFRADNVIKTYKILLEYGYKFDHHKYNNYVLYEFMKSLAIKLKYKYDDYDVKKVYNHPEVRKYFGKEIIITKRHIERAKRLYEHYKIDKDIEELPDEFPKFMYKTYST